MTNISRSFALLLICCLSFLTLFTFLWQIWPNQRWALNSCDCTLVCWNLQFDIVWVISIIFVSMVALFMIRKKFRLSEIKLLMCWIWYKKAHLHLNALVSCNTADVLIKFIRQVGLWKWHWFSSSGWWTAVKENWERHITMKAHLSFIYEKLEQSATGHQSCIIISPFSHFEPSNLWI